MTTNELLAAVSAHWRRYPLAFMTAWLVTTVAAHGADGISAATEAARTLQARLGGHLQVRHVDAHGRVRDVRGRTASITRDPTRDGARAVRSFLGTNSDLFGGSVGSLVHARVRQLDLVGTTAKVMVSYAQEDGGLCVHGAQASVLLDQQGCVLAVQSTLAPVARSAAAPALTEAEATQKAIAAIPGSVAVRADPVLAAGPEDLAVHEAYRVLLSVPFAAEPEGYCVIVDAVTGAILEQRATIYHVDLTGTLHGYYINTMLPDSASNTEVDGTIEGALLSGPLGNTISAGDGTWTLLPSGGGAQSVTASLASARVLVVNAAGSNLSVSGSATPGTPLTLTINQGRTEYETAQMNALTTITRFQNWVHSVDALETTMDFQVVANVNIASTCNAYWNGSSINFYRAGGGCVNSAYSSVVAHELGHWANDRFNGGMTGAFHEGAADVWAMYIFDNPVVGQDFGGSGTYIRTGLNATMYCGNDLEACHGGEVHKEGEPLMGAFWKMRQRLNTALGDAAGDAVANALFIGWMQAFDDNRVSDIIEEHLLALDDDDGNIYNGTPHFSEIDGGFKDQGFPGLDPSHITIEHAQGSSSVPGTAVPITAVIASLDATPITTALVLYSINRGSTWSSAAMNATGAPDTFSGTIPAFAAGTTVWYYIQAVNANASSSVLPASAPDDSRFFYFVGYALEANRFDFEGTTEAGWSHSAAYGTDDWTRGAPLGKGGDPSTAGSGAKVFGNDLAEDGKYVSYSKSTLYSPIMDLSGVTGTHLSFLRWLGSEDGIYDHATVRVNGTAVWTNPGGGGDDSLVDTSWTRQEIDISALADNNASVQISFEMQSDQLYNFGGWTIDDVRVTNVVAQNLNCTPAADDNGGTPGSGGYVPNIYLAQGAPVAGNTSLQVRGDQMKGGTAALLLMGAYPADLAVLGIRLKVDPFMPHQLFLRSSSGSGSGQGRATMPFPIPNLPGIGGIHLYLQWIVVDAGAPQGLAASGGLDLVICQ
ncbi:MAG: hypothetical protein U1E76_18290 [Planctomycetota bacterium]